MRSFRIVLGAVAGLAGMLLIAATYLAVEEARESRWQSRWLSRIAEEATFEVREGASEAIAFPEAGPFDRRLGYARLPAWTQRLRKHGFEVTAQAHWSPRLMQLDTLGLFVPFDEKTQAGLELLDCRAEPFYTARHPERIYASYEDVPPVVREMLVFIENRKLFEPEATRNPAIDWLRLGRAAFDQAVQSVFSSHPAAGGSTLATQIEKYRHSPGGRTSTPKDKAMQIASASVRSYLDGPDTLPRRRQIVLDYLNTVPLSALGGYGEVIGLGEALRVWYGRDFEEVNRLLRLVPTAPTGAAAATSEVPSSVPPGQALALKQVLSLVVAQRRPSYYLGAAGLQDLRELTDAHLRLLARAGLVPPALRDAALPLPLRLEPAVPPPASAPSFVDAKASTALRTRLLDLLTLPGAYDLDRTDLRAASTFASDVQRQAGALLRSLGTPEGARRAGLYGRSLLREGDDPGRIAYSFTLYERDGRSNQLRVQTDNQDQPFDLNEGARLDLGSTAKLRTLITYLEQVAALHERWSALAPQELAALKIRPEDAISRWARDWLARSGGRSLAAMLDAAMLRTYSADPGERFATGGGLHTFGNFEPRDNNRVMTLQEALTRSVNLPFIRLMRDIVHHVIAVDPALSPEVLDDAADPRRRAYLERFADAEGSVFVARFHRKYRELAGDALRGRLVEGVRKSGTAMANAFFVLRPQGSAEELERFLQRWLPAAASSAAELHERHGPGRWSLNDRAYLARAHPLDLWVAAYLLREPDAGLQEVLDASVAQRQEVYAWLFKTSRKSAQDRRIREQLEVQAFERVQQAWQRLGYPFERLTPSYASALGASGDRPSALAELVGILGNGGLRLPVIRLRHLAFARGTPYETHFERTPAPAVRVLAPEVAQTARNAMRRVVEEGTARRARGALLAADGAPLEIAGKTGTGDHRFEVRGAGGRLLSSRVVNRSATFVFLIGERYHGTLMAYAHEPHAANYTFTSALPTQVLKALAPILQPLMAQPGCGAALRTAAPVEASPPTTG